MMAEYATLTIGGDGFFYALQQLFTKVMDFIQTPGGWAFIAVIMALFFVFNKR